MPLVCDLRPLGRKVVKPRQDPFARVIRTTTSCHAARHSRVPLVPAWSQPPNLLAGPRHHVAGRRPVLSRVPLRGENWMHGGKVIETRQHAFTCTDRATRPVQPMTRHRFPLMSALSEPPELLARSSQYILRCHGVVLCWMPLIREARVCGGEVCRRNEIRRRECDSTPASP